MPTLSLRDAAEQAGTSKSTIWRAIKSGRLSAARTDDGGFAIDPAELFRVFQPQRLEHRPAGHDAAIEAEVKGLRDLLAEVKAHRERLHSGSRSHLACQQSTARP
jgi:excisionase family DNA binding protein